MFPFDADCSYCSNLNPNDYKGGKYWCTKKREYVSARGSLCKDAHETMGRPNCDKKRLRDYSKEHGYYIITAISNILGLENDNQYLESFKYLRDVILPSRDEYISFIYDYEEFGPIIAENLKNDLDKENYSLYLKTHYLDRFVSLFIEDKIDEAMKLYIELVSVLKERYNIKRINNREEKLVVNIEDVISVYTEMIKSIRTKLSNNSRVYK